MDQLPTDDQLVESLKLPKTWDLLTVDELAQVLKVPRSWVYSKTRQTGQDTIPRIHVGKYLRFELQSIITWLKKCQEMEGCGIDRVRV